LSDQALRLTIHGRVQGVGYRAWTLDEARRLGLRGWVRNRADGSVEALAIGDPVAIETLATLCARGPHFARVDSVERHPASDDGSPGFEQAPTA